MEVCVEELGRNHSNTDLFFCLTFWHLLFLSDEFHELCCSSIKSINPLLSIMKLFGRGVVSKPKLKAKLHARDSPIEPS